MDMDKLRIRDIQARAVIAPLEPPIRTAAGHVLKAPLLLIDLSTEEGVVGRSYLFGYQAFTLGPLRELVRALGAIVKGDAVAPIELDQKLRARMALFGTRGLQGMAVAGIDMAAWDALAVAAGVPLVHFLGGQSRPIPAYNSLGMIPPAEATDEAAKTVAAGFRALKIKIGWPSLAEDLAVVRAARKALPDDVALMVDFNQSLATPEAIRRGRVLDGEGIAWIEEPVRADDFRGSAEVAAQLATPIQIGENFNGVPEMELALRMKASDLVMPDVQQIGGVTGWLRAAALAQVAGVPCSSHIFIEVSAHLLAVTPTCHFIEYLDVAAPILAEPLRPVDGALQAPRRPGIGLAWDEDAARRYHVA
jgi:mandelate racemase